MPEEPTGSERPADEQQTGTHQTEQARAQSAQGQGQGPEPGPGQGQGQGPGQGPGYPPPPPPGQGFPPSGAYQGLGGYQPSGGYHGPGGYPPPAPRRLTRRTDDRVLGGVSSGLGLYFGIDPVVFRIGFVALTLAGGAGILVYLLLWVVLPGVAYDGVHGPPPSPSPRQGEAPILTTLRQGGFKSYLAIGAIVLAVLLLISPFARPEVVFALLLIGVGIMLMMQDRNERGGPPAPGQLGQPGQPSQPGQPGGQPGQPWQGPPASPPGGGPGPGGWNPGGGWPGGPEPGPGAEPTSGHDAGRDAGHGVGGGPEPRPGAEPVPGGWQGTAESPSRVSAESAPRASTATTERITVHDEPRAAGSAPDWTYGAGATAGGSPGWGQGGWGTPAASAAGAAAASPPGSWGSTGTAMAPRERVPRQRSMLGWFTVAAALLAAGIATALDNLGAIDMTPARVLALALTVVGVGLLIGSLWGRAWWLILLGLLLVPTAGIAGLVNGLPVSGQGGDQVFRPLTVADVQPSYKVGGGHLTLDLRQVHFGAESVAVDAKVTAGELDVLLPPDLPVTVHSRISAGEIDVLGRQNGGIQIENTVTEPGARGSGQLQLNLRVGLGQIKVNRG